MTAISRKAVRQGWNDWFSEMLWVNPATVTYLRFSTFTFRGRPWCSGCGEMLIRPGRPKRGVMAEELVGRYHLKDCPLKGKLPRMVPPSAKMVRSVVGQLLDDMRRCGRRGIPTAFSIEQGREGRYHGHGLFAPRRYQHTRYLEARIGLHQKDYGFTQTRRVDGADAVLAYTIKHQTRQNAVGAYLIPARGQPTIMNLDGYPLDTELDGSSNPSWRLRQPVAQTGQRTMRFDEVPDQPPIMPGQRQLELT